MSQQAKLRFDSGPDLLRHFQAVRAVTESLAAPLSPEDCQLQAVPEVSPTKWHLAHTSWFFEEFILLPFDAAYKRQDASFGYLFNSYYESVAPFLPRPRRGLISRPSLGEVAAYRQRVTEAVSELLAAPPSEARQEIEQRLLLGLNHEQQHQELLLTDIKLNLAAHPSQPSYLPASAVDRAPVTTPITPLGWRAYEGGLKEIGHRGTGFAFDNESPRHRVFLEPFELTERLVTAGEFLEFIGDGGYQRPELWLSDGWQAVHSGSWQAPLYWQMIDGTWQHTTLSGVRPLAPSEPVAHVSYYEAQAFATWLGARLPTETEWEVVAEGMTPTHGNFLDSGLLHPQAATSTDAARSATLSGLFGDVWEWTQSAYLPYPGFAASEGALGEYNGKFMCNQMVLRGGSCLTPRGHVRASYRNFFPPDTRWQMSGFRLARTI